MRMNRHSKGWPTADRSGQAMVEFIVGLVAVMALLAGLLQVASLGKAHTDSMVEARREAADLAMMDLGDGTVVLSDPDYIQEWNVGPDGRHHSRDDTWTEANAGEFNERIVDRAAADPEGWSILGDVPNNPIGQLHGNWDAVAALGLVHGHDERPVPLLPAVRSLLYRADSVDVECDVWLTWTKGIY